MVLNPPLLVKCEIKQKASSKSNYNDYVYICMSFVFVSIGDMIGETLYVLLVLLVYTNFSVYI